MCKVAIIINLMVCYLRRQLEYFELTKNTYSDTYYIKRGFIELHCISSRPRDTVKTFR